MLKTALLTLLLSLGTLLPQTVLARSLVVTVYLHNDLAGESDEQINTNFFGHWLKEMHTITQHPVELIFRRNVEGVTDINYAGKPSREVLDTFTAAIKDSEAGKLFSHMNKHLLMTRGSYDHRGLNFNAGIAFQKGNTAIASVAVYGAAAHEIGHMLGATHEDATVNFNGWACETYTKPRLPLRSNCYRYSDKNRATIVDYLKYNSN